MRVPEFVFFTIYLRVLILKLLLVSCVYACRNELESLTLTSALFLCLSLFLGVLLLQVFCVLESFTRAGACVFGSCMFLYLAGKEGTEAQ